MKLTKLIVYMLAATMSLSLSACAEEEEKSVGESVEVDGLEDIRFAYDGSRSVEFTITSTRTWSISKSDLPWVRVSQMNGGFNKPATVTLTADLNDDLERSGSLTLNSGSYTKTVSVTQDAYPIVPELVIYDLESNIVEFGFNMNEPVTFRVYSNVAWTAEKTNLDWLDISQMSGGRKTESSISITAEDNDSEAREGAITFKGEGAPEVTLTIRQAKFVEAPIFQVSGAGEDNKLSFEASENSAVSLTVISNRSWTAETSADSDWLTVNPASGESNIDGTTVSVSVADNEDPSERTATITFKCNDEDVEDVVITVIQAGETPLPTEWTWTLEDSVLKSTDWADQTKRSATDDSKTAVMTWNVVNGDECYTTPANQSTIISSKGEGHYAVKCMWDGDYFEFTLPVRNFKAGTSVNIKYAMSGTTVAACFWNVQYLDGDTWKTTSSSTQTNAYSISYDCTYALQKTSTKNINETATFTNAVDKGHIRIRITCATGQYLCGGKTVKKADKAGTVRIRQWSDGSCDAIKIKIIE